MRWSISTLGHFLKGSGFDNFSIMKGFMKETSFIVLATVYCASLVLAHGYVEYVVVDGKL